MPYETIIDSGTEWTIAGGSAWLIKKLHQRSMRISAVDSAMPAVRLSLCDAVTAVKDDDNQIQLIGVRKCGYSPSLNDEEAVLNVADPQASPRMWATLWSLGRKIWRRNIPSNA